MKNKLQFFIAINKTIKAFNNPKVNKPVTRSTERQHKIKSNNKPAIHIGLCVDDKRALIGSNVAVLIMQVNTCAYNTKPGLVGTKADDQWQPVIHKSRLKLVDKHAYYP